MVFLLTQLAATIVLNDNKINALDTQNTTQANFNLTNHILRAFLQSNAREARNYGLLGQSLLEWCFEK